MTKVFNIFIALVTLAAISCTADTTNDCITTTNEGTTSLSLSLNSFRTHIGEKIDGERLCKSPSVMGLPNSNVNPYNTEPNSPFVIDELKIWDYA